MTDRTVSPSNMDALDRRVKSTIEDIYSDMLEQVNEMPNSADLLAHFQKHGFDYMLNWGISEIFEQKLMNALSDKGWEVMVTLENSCTIITLAFPSKSETTQLELI